MMRWRFGGAGWVSLTALLAALLTGPAFAAADDDDENLDTTVLLDVVINGEPIHKLGEFSIRDGILRAKRQELKDLGFLVADATALSPDNELAVAIALVGAQLRIDQPAQTLYVTVPDTALVPTRFSFADRRDNEVASQSGTGTVLDYDIVAAGNGGRVTASGSFGLRVFAPIGVVSSDALVFVGREVSNLPSFIRLDTRYVYTDEQNLRSYVVGDFITGGLAWSRPVRLGGARIAADFRTRPDLITFPVPAVTGSVAVPSSLDVFVNGSRIGSRNVPPGPFEVSRMPVVTGAGTISTTTTDAMGRQITTDTPFYASADLLAPGLQTWSFDIGAVRRRWGSESNNYGGIATAATVRRGMTSTLTLEAHAEAVSGLLMGGGGVVLNIANAATLEVAGAVSIVEGRVQPLVSISAQRISRTFSIGVSATLAGHGFRDIAAMNGEPYPYRQFTANIGLPMGRSGSIGAFFVASDRDANAIPIDRGNVGGFPPLFVPAARMRLATANYTRQFRNFALYVNGFKDFAAGGGYGVMAGISLPFGSRASADASMGWGANGVFGQAQASQAAVAIGDWGYRLYAAGGKPNQAFAEAEYMAPFATVRAGGAVVGSQTAYHAEVRGAVSLADGAVFASNRIDDSFAIVDTHGAKGIRVLVENRFAGVTDASGRLLVPALRSFQLNNVSIDPVGAPMDASMPVTSMRVKPAYRSGVVVDFPVTASHSASLRLVDGAGQVLPVGSVVTTGETGAAQQMGFDGETYLVGLALGRNIVTVAMPDGKTCTAQFTYQPVANDIPTIGPLTCASQK
jgi:outer membrane usher protein